MKADAVFQGGGVKGIGFVGAICRMERAGFKWEKLAGTSAGAIIASLLAVGYSGIELKKIVANLDYMKLLDKSTIQSLPLVGRSLGILFEKGYYKTDNIEKWLRSLYLAKGKTKFKDLWKAGNKSPLKIIASDVTNKNMIIFPDNLVDYGFDPYEFDIARAVTMSICIPIFFSPQILNYKNKKSFVVDGGIYSSFPIWIFDTPGIPRWPTFGFKFMSEKNKIKLKHNPFAYFMDLFDSIIDTVDEDFIRNKDSVRTISIPTYDIKATQFEITRVQSQELYLSGYNSANSFLESWDFKKYIEKYRK
jgi:NTE family protein